MMTKSLENVNHRPSDAADEIAEAVHALMHLYRTQQHRALREGQKALTHMEARVLTFFARNPGATQSDLIAHSARDKGQLARLIGALRDGRLLEARVDDADRRIQRLHLTTEGRAIQAALQRQRSRVARMAVAGLADDDRSRLVELLRRVRSNLEAAGS